jgi:hypothetical protein
MTDEEYAFWPKCAFPVCQFKSCLRLGSKYCWPHTPGTPEQAMENLAKTLEQPETEAVA